MKSRSRCRRDSRLIPVTSLRRFYRMLGKLTECDFQLAAAKECGRKPGAKGLQELITESVAHIEHYDNRREPFRPKAVQGRMSDVSEKSSFEARRLLSLIGHGGFVGDRIRSSFVDYEVSPIRTTQSQFEDGRSGRGSKGGIDVLLVDDQDRLPVVGEVKAATDRNLFVAFVQALTYAVELSSKHQQERLCTSYPDARFEMPPTGPFIDLAFLMATKSNASRYEEFVPVVQSLVTKLHGNPPFSDIVRRVHCFRLDFNEDGLSCPEKHFSVGSS